MDLSHFSNTHVPVEQNLYRIIPPVKYLAEVFHMAFRHEIQLKKALSEL